MICKLISAVRALAEQNHANHGSDGNVTWDQCSRKSCVQAVFSLGKAGLWQAQEADVCLEIVPITQTAESNPSSEINISIAKESRAGEDESYEP